MFQNYWPILFLLLACYCLNCIAKNVDDDDTPCDNHGDLFVPQNYTRYPAEKYPFGEAGLQLYTHRQIKCDGYLVEWQFISQTKTVFGLHLAVFRPARNGFYFLVNSTYIRLSTIREFKMPQWVSFLPSEPFFVRSGDILAIFYDSFKTPRNMLTIVNRGPASDYDKPNTFILPVGLIDILAPNIDYENIKVHVGKSTVFQYREPALTAVISSSHVTRRLSSSSATTSSSKNATVNSSTTSSKRAPGNRQTPSSRRNSRTKQSSTRSSTKKVTPPPRRECSAKDEIISPTGAFTYESHESYPFLEAGLHIFEELRVNCSGYLVEWNFLAPLNHSVIYGLYLAIFRPVDPKRTSFRLVNATYLRLVVLPKWKIGNWLAYPLPAHQQMRVEQGDYLGFYYARFQTAQNLLTIASTSYNPNGENYTSWVFEYDSKRLEAMSTNSIFSAKQAEKTYRRAALTAKVSRVIQPRPGKMATTTVPTLTTLGRTTTMPVKQSKLPKKTSTNKSPRRTFAAPFGKTTSVTTTQTPVSTTPVPATSTTLAATKKKRRRTTTTVIRRTPLTTTVETSTVAPTTSTSTSTTGTSTGTTTRTTLPPPHPSTPSSTTTRKQVIRTTRTLPVVETTSSLLRTMTSEKVTSTVTSRPRTSTTLQRTSVTNKAFTTTEPNQMIYLTIIDRGRSICSYYRTPTTVHRFDSEDECMDFVGNNQKECNDDNFNYGICVDANSNCKLIDANVYTRHSSASACYASVDSFFFSCIHQNERSGSLYCSPSVTNSKGCYTNDGMCQSAGNDTIRMDLLRRVASRNGSGRKHSPNTNVFLNVIEKGKTECSYHPTPTTLYKFSTLERCELFAGDNARMCEEEVVGLAVCIDSKSECSSLMLKTAEIFLSSEQCFDEVDSYHNSCLHLDSETGALFCSPVMYHAEECYIDTDACELAKYNRKPAAGGKVRGRAVDRQSIQSEETTPSQPEFEKVYLNLWARGTTACESKTNNATLVIFADYESCQRFRGDNRKVCGQLNGDFGACIDSKADCSLIGAVGHETHETSENCYQEVDTFYTSCIQVDSDGRWFCSTLIKDSLSCYQDDNTCQSAFEWSRGVSFNNNNVTEYQSNSQKHQQQSAVKGKTAANDLSFLTAFSRRQSPVINFNSKSSLSPSNT